MIKRLSKALVSTLLVISLPFNAVGQHYNTKTHKCDKLIPLNVKELTLGNSEMKDLTCRKKEYLWEDVPWNKLNLSGGYFKGANFFYKNLKNVFFLGANLKNSQFTGASLDNVHFNNANLEGADFSHPGKIDSVEFYGANLKKANLLSFPIQNASFVKANLEGAIWTNGEICQKGSIGKCITKESLKQESNYAQESQEPKDIAKLTKEHYSELVELFSRKNWINLDSAIKDFAKAKGCRLTKNDSCRFPDGRYYSNRQLIKGALYEKLKPSLEKVLEIMKENDACAWDGSVRGGNPYFKIFCDSNLRQSIDSLRENKLFGDIEIRMNGRPNKKTDIDSISGIELTYYADRENRATYNEKSIYIHNDSNGLAILIGDTFNARELMNSSFGTISHPSHNLLEEESIWTKGLISREKATMANGAYKYLLEEAASYYEENKKELSTPGEIYTAPYLKGLGLQTH